MLIYVIALNFAEAVQRYNKGADTRDAIIGGGIAALGLLVFWSTVVIYSNRKVFYNNNVEKKYDLLLKREFYNFITANISFVVTEKQLKDLVAYEHSNFKIRHLNLGPRISSSQMRFASVLVRNQGSRRRLYKLMSREFPQYSKKDIKKIIQLEEKYLRKN